MINWANARAKFPVTKSSVYLNTAAAGPLADSTAKAGASYVSPFIGRLDDVGQEGMDVIREARTIFDNYNIETEILAASIRHPRHVVDAAMIGADVATLPPEVLKKLLLHPLTDRGLEQFLADWNKLVARAKAAV